MSENKDSLLVIVDMINGFINEGAMSDKGINHITSDLVKLTESFIENKRPIIAFIDAHDEDAKEFDSFPPHCIRGTSESELIDELLVYKDSMSVLEKNSTNGFLQPEFLEHFNSIKPSKVYITGCCTDICVLQFALTLSGYINQYDLDIEVNVVKDLVETYDSEIHQREKMNEISFILLKQAGIKVINRIEIED